MRWLIKAFWYFIAVICLVGRVIYAAGQTYFGMKSATDYMKASPTVSTALNLTAVATTAVSTIIGKTPAAWKQFSPGERPAQPANAPKPPLGWTAWSFKKTIDGSGFFYGVTNGIAGYFGTRKLSEATGLKGTGWTAAFQSTAAAVGVTSLASYYSYDFSRIRMYSEQMARAIDERDIPCNRAMAYTLGVAVAIIPTYVGQAYFWARPSIVALPYAEAILHEPGINIGVILACVTTFFTVIGWLPAVYNYFANNQPEDQERVAIPANLGSHTLKAAAYIAGAGDSLGGNGMGLFISMIVMLNSLFGLNPYGWIIGYAAVCGLNAAIMNGMFSVLPGLDDAEQLIYRNSPIPAPANDVEAPLLVTDENRHGYGTTDAAKRPVFTRNNSQSGLLFFSALDKEKLEHQPEPQSTATAPTQAMNIKLEP